MAEVKKIKENMTVLAQRIAEIEKRIDETHKIIEDVASKWQSKLDDIDKKNEIMLAQVYKSSHAIVRASFDQMKQECRLVAEEYLRDRLAKISTPSTTSQ